MYSRDDVELALYALEEGMGARGGGRARGLRRDRREGVVEGAPPPLGRRAW